MADAGLLEVDDLHVGYGRVPVLRGLSLRVAEGERVGLFGPNGHGKSTLLRTISGLHRATSGHIRFSGTEIQTTDPAMLVGMGVVHVPQGSPLFPRLTVENSLMLGAYHPRAWPRRKDMAERVYGLFPRLAERRRQLAGTLSGGERQMLAIGVGLMAGTRLLMLDEPTLGLAPKVKDELRESIAAVAAEGIPLLLVEQDIDFLLALTDRLYLVEGGKVVLETEASSHDLDHQAILQMYFGSGVGDTTPT